MGKDNSKVNDVERSGNLYQLAGKPPLGEALPLALQHGRVIFPDDIPGFYLSVSGQTAQIQTVFFIEGFA